MSEMRANSGRSFGVMVVQLFPPSRVMEASPSSEPVQMVPASWYDGAMVKIVAYTSGPFMSWVIGPPEGPRVFGSARVRSPEIRSQVWPSLVVFQRCCEEAKITLGSSGEKTIG